MTWNYRVGYDETGQTFAIYSAYYSDEGEVTSTSTEPAVVEGGSLEELRAELGRMLAALGSPVLSMEKFSD